MSGYGFGECKLCGAVDDYCTVRGAQGCDIDCRILADMLTQEQQTAIREQMTPDWWLEEQQEKGSKTWVEQKMIGKRHVNPRSI